MAITSAQKTRLGVFVVIGMIILAAFIVVPIGNKMSTHTKTYITFFRGESLQGLDQGASVKFNGVSIGKVQKVSYYPQDINKMKVELSVSDQFPMKVDMYSTTGTVGITGLKYIEISGGSNKAALLKPGGEIPSRVSFMANISGKAEVLTEKVEILLNHVNILTHPDSMQPVRVAMGNLAELTGDAKEAFSDIRTFIPKAGVMADTIQRAVDEALLAVQDVRAVTGTFRDVISDSDLTGMMERMDSTVTSIQTLAENLSLMVRQTQEDFSVSMENLREAMESANQLMRTLSENPSLLLRGEKQERDNR
jgi:phospholipid/cholesterol/gamma-HCH transport system substrate-binding protein